MEIEARDIHGFEKRIPQLLTLIENDNRIIPDNRSQIKKYSDYLKARSLKTSTIHKELYAVRNIGGILGDVGFKSATKEDFVRVLAEINKRKWTEWTRRNHRISLKHFIKWVYGIEKKGIYPDCVDWVVAGKKVESKLTSEDLITKAEFEKLLEACDNVRDKCFLAVLMEGGVRIQEALSIRKNHIVFDGEIADVVVIGKTGMGKIPLVSAAPLLKKLLREHPTKKADDFLFMTKFSSIGKGDYVPLGYAATRKLLRRLQKKTGIGKRLFPHLFRHSSATEDAKWMSNRMLMQKYRWRTDLMVQRYSHLSDDDLKDAVKKHAGFEEEEVAENEMAKFMRALTVMVKKDKKFAESMKKIMEGV